MTSNIENALSLQRALAFLRALGLEHGFLEIRLLLKKSPHWRLFIKPDRWAKDIEDAIRANFAESSELLFSVNPRWMKGGTDYHVSVVRAAVIDLDGKGLPIEEQKRRVWALAQFALPVAVVASGTADHFHVYWRFVPFVPTDVARPVVKRLRLWLQTDPSEPESKMMRLPESFNWKSGGPKRIEIGRHFVPSATTTIEALSAGLDRLGAPQLDDASRRSARPRASSDATANAAPQQIASNQAMDPALLVLLGRLPTWASNLIASGHVEGDRYLSRSEADAGVVRALLEAGATDLEIAQIFAVTATGSKYRKAGDGYLAKTIDFVRRTIPEESIVFVEEVRLSWEGWLRLRVEHGPYAGRTFWQRVDSKKSFWRWMFRAFGLQQASSGDDRAALALQGLRCPVRLHDGLYGLEVKKWVEKR